MRITIANQEEIDEYVSLMRPVFEGHLIDSGWDELRAHTFAKQVGGDALVLNLKMDGKHIGWAEIAMDDFRLDIISVYIRDYYRRKGLTNKVLNLLIDMYGDNRIIQTFCLMANTASMEMHRKLGFQMTGVTWIYNKHLGGHSE